MTVETTIITFPGGRRRPDLEADTTGVKFLNDYFEFNQEFTFEAANVARAQAEVNGGFPVNSRARTDNVFDRNPRLVKPLGKIEYFAPITVTQSIIEIYELIIERSPIMTGQFRAANWVFFNSKLVAKSVNELRTFILSQLGGDGFKTGDTVRYVNVAPYARRIEYLGVRRGTRGKFAGLNQKRGKKVRISKKTGNLILKPSGSYQLSYVLARKRFKSVAQRIKFGFITTGTGGISIPVYPLRGQSSRNTFKGGKSGRAGRPYLYPSITITLDKRGIVDE